MTTPGFSFRIEKIDTGSAARTGRLTTPDGVVETPQFIPVGTLATVKGLTPDNLRDAGATIALGNTYHLMQKPGTDVLEKSGGLGKFMSWDRVTLTDSGGFQVFSLADTRKVTEDGVKFRSVYDGAMLEMNPESVYQIQRSIGADIIYALDECPPYPCSERDVKQAVERTTRWGRRFIDAWKAGNDASRSQFPFLVVQGGVYPALREQSVAELAEIEPGGFGIGGLSVGEPRDDMEQMAGLCCEQLPKEYPRHLMGVGTPEDLLNAVAVGVDLFDCVLPTRNGRNGQAFTSTGVKNIRNARFRLEQDELDHACDCYTCRNFAVAYLHHLIMTGEILGLSLVSLHNIHYYLSLMATIRKSIEKGYFGQIRNQIVSQWTQES